jgi:hypothetical protein
MIKKTVLYRIIGIFVLFLLIQLIPYGHNHTNPPVVKEPAWNSPQTKALVQAACYDCHSNQTHWYWYTNIAPFSWLVQRDADEGRRRLNFSECGVARPNGRPSEGIAEAGRAVLRGSMPPIQYWLIHPQANLSQADRQTLATGLANSPCQ